MGCGASNSNAVNNTAQSRPSRPANTTTVPVQRSGAIQHKPLIKAKNYRHGSNLTQRDLMEQRENFWSSRVEGNVHMWQNIRSAAEALASDDLMLANAILEASHIISPTGTMETLYDERGAQYKLPVFTYANPVELVGESPSEGAQASPSPFPSPSPVVAAVAVSGASNSSSPNVKAVAKSGTNTPVVSRSTPVATAEPLQLKIRINPGDINMTVLAQATFSIGELKHSIVEQNMQSAVPIPDIAEDRQRIIFMGRELQNTQRLNDLGFDEQKVVQVFLRPGGK